MNTKYFIEKFYYISAYLKPKIEYFLEWIVNIFFDINSCGESKEKKYYEKLSECVFSFEKEEKKKKLLDSLFSEYVKRQHNCDSLNNKEDIYYQILQERSGLVEKKSETKFLYCIDEDDKELYKQILEEYITAIKQIKNKHREEYLLRTYKERYDFCIRDYYQALKEQNIYSKVCITRHEYKKCESFNRKIELQKEYKKSVEEYLSVLREGDMEYRSQLEKHYYRDKHYEYK